MATSQLCSLCMAVFSTPFPYELYDSTGSTDHRFNHHSSPDALLNSSLSCHLCALAWEPSEKKDKHDGGDCRNASFYFKRRWYRPDAYTSERVQFQLFFDEPGPSYDEIHIAGFIGHPLEGCLHFLISSVEIG